MTKTMDYVIYLLLLALGLAAGYWLKKQRALAEINSAEAKAEKILTEAKSKEKQLILEAQEKSLQFLEEAKERFFAGA